MEMPCVATYKGKVVNNIISIKDENIDKIITINYVEDMPANFTGVLVEKQNEVFYLLPKTFEYSINLYREKYLTIGYLNLMLNSTINIYIDGKQQYINEYIKRRNSNILCNGEKLYCLFWLYVLNGLVDYKHVQVTNSSPNFIILRFYDNDKLIDYFVEYKYDQIHGTVKCGFGYYVNDLYFIINNGSIYYNDYLNNIIDVKKILFTVNTYGLLPVYENYTIVPIEKLMRQVVYKSLEEKGINITEDIENSIDNMFKIAPIEY